MLKAENRGDRLHFGHGLAVRLLWMPFAMSDPMRSCAGVLPLYRAADYAEHVPESWRRPGTWFVPILYRAAIWIEFVVRPDAANAVKLGLDSLNLLTWAHWRDPLVAKPQDYLVLAGTPFASAWKNQPVQTHPWLIVGFDHPSTADQHHRRRLDLAHLRIKAYHARPDVFADRPDASAQGGVAHIGHADDGPSPAPLLLKTDHCPIIPPADPFGPAAWETANGYAADVYPVSYLDFRRITGEEPPPPRMIPGLGGDLGAWDA